ncbi:MAG: DNA polymerase III subunit delta [Legionella sp.]|uniref:DNA polymerase III subunit delta n=1 Tax=Legionella sp. TaxID=459 RepID=UPI0039E58080
MQIKQHMLAQQMQKKIHPLYLLTGQDSYLLDESLSLIKTAIKAKYNCDEKIISIHSADDWNIVLEEANSYSLFSDTVLLNIFYDKKIFDAAGKKVLTAYLNEVNTRCFIIIRAPNLPAKQLHWLTSHEHALISVAYPLTAGNMKKWIAVQLKNKAINFAPQVPDLIHQYTQGNMLACAQVIEKISLTNAVNSTITMQQAHEHLSNQCDHNLLELVDACLLGEADKAIQILRHAANNKTEAILVLWMLTQEIRTLLQLTNLVQNQMDINSACTQLKIWPMRINLYQKSYSRFNSVTLKQLHQYCNIIDERIKSSYFNTQIWNSLENLALSLCIGALIGDACTL